MAQNYSPPLKFNNNDLVEIVELDNSLPLRDYNLTDNKFEAYICANLAHEKLPQDLENTFPSAGSNSLSIVPDGDIDGPQLIGKTAVLNNENLINNELFAMKVNYTILGGITPDSANIPIGDITPNTISLDPSSNTIFNSNLKIDIEYNNNDQYTDINQDNSGVWVVSGNRGTNYGIYNTFSAVNSIYNKANGESPFYIQENDDNTCSLGQNDGKWFSQVWNGLNVGDGQLAPQDIDIEYNLENNNIVSTVMDGADYLFDQFNKYQLVQDAPTIETTFSDSANNLPYQYVDGGSAYDVTTNTFNFSGAFQNTTDVLSGFNMVLDVSAGGGYNMDSNVLFTLDQSELTRDATDPYVQLQNLQDLSHILTVVNGTTALSTSTSNPEYIIIADEYETLDSSFNGTNGLINIIVDPDYNRVYYTDGSNISGSYGTKTTLTDSVVIKYPGEDSPSIADFSGGELLVTEDVNFYVEILAPTTVYNNAQDFLNEDLSRNLAFDANTVLALASPDMPTVGSIVQTDFSLNSSLNVAPDQIYIISIENQSILTQDSPLFDASGDVVVGTTATVSMTNIDLSNNASPYSDFEVRLNTKTIGDLSNTLLLTNGWSIVGSSDTYLQGTALQTGVINDDYLFMTTYPAVAIDMSYAFQIANPVCASIQAIKRQIQITFKDLSYSNISSDGLSQNENETVFLLDDQDITLHNKVIVDTSMAICNNIASTNPSYPVASYTFQKHTQTITYTASFLSKFQFYTNVSFQTPEITEQAVYYKILKNGVEQPSYLLKWFTDGCNDGKLLSNVYVSLVGEPIVTGFSYTQHACSILTASIWGKDNTGTFVKLDSAPIDIDPFFRQNGVVVNLLDGQPGSNGHADISVKFPSDIPVNSSSYRIELSTGLGENQSLTAKRYIYTAPGTELDAYANHGFIYNNFYSTLMLNEPLLTTIVDRIDGITRVTIKDGNVTLAVVEHPDTYIYNYNIVSGLAPLARVDYTVGTAPTVSTRLLAYNQEINILEGVWYYFNASNAVVGANEAFALVTDSFNLKHVDDNGYSYNTYASTQKFDCSNIQLELVCSADINTNYARSVTFSQLRGYQYLNGGDAITIERTITTATFNLNIDSNYIATKYLDNIYNGSSYQLNNVEFDETYYSLGLILDFDKSMLKSTDPLSYQIFVSVANYNLFVNGALQESNYLTQNTDLLMPYFTGLKPAAITATSNYSLSVSYTVPDLVINSYNSDADYKYIGNPLAVDPSDWALYADVSFNTLLNGYLVIPGFKIQQYSLANVFYDAHTSYFVIAPPAVTVYGITDFSNGAITSLPINSSSVAMASLHINHDSNSYTITPTYLIQTPITFQEYDIKPYSDYKYIRNNSYENKYFRLKGNYASINLYLNGTDSNGLNSPATVDANTQPIDTLFTQEILSDLAYNSPFNGNNVNITDDYYVNYVAYNQFLPSANQHNATANIMFALGNYFTPASTTYLRLAVNTGSSLAFYQSNLLYDETGPSYYISIDRYKTDAVVNYNTLLLGGTVNELVFPISSHDVKQFVINNNDIIDSNGNLSDISGILSSITQNDIENASWVSDASFELQYLGLTLSAVTDQGITNLNNVLTYSSGASLDSKALYINLPDIINVRNILGNTIYRVTNSGNVHAPRVTTSNVSLFVNPAVDPTTNNIVGAMDIQSIFAQNSLLSDENVTVLP